MCVILQLQPCSFRTFEALLTLFWRIPNSCCTTTLNEETGVRSFWITPQLIAIFSRISLVFKYSIRSSIDYSISIRTSLSTGDCWELHYVKPLTVQLLTSCSIVWFSSLSLMPLSLIKNFCMTLYCIVNTNKQPMNIDVQLTGRLYKQDKPSKLGQTGLVFGFWSKFMSARAWLQGHMCSGDDSCHLNRHKNTHTHEHTYRLRDRQTCSNRSQVNKKCSVVPYTAY